MRLFDWIDARLMTSDELLQIDEVPESLAVVGGGVIGCEFASVFSRLGSQVTVIEMMDQLLPGEESAPGARCSRPSRRPASRCTSRPPWRRPCRATPA